jgi:hypothetical protein
LEEAVSKRKEGTFYAAMDVPKKQRSVFLLTCCFLLTNFISTQGGPLKMLNWPCLHPALDAQNCTKNFSSAAY